MTDVPADPQPDRETTTGSAPGTPPADDGSALDRAATAIHEARDAEGTVAANDDITSRDDERAEQHSDDPGAGDDVA
jgi:hypothetical protein